jgi:NAD(P)H dehydrogenase (quinone)
MNTSEKILVTGASGHLGKLVLDELLNKGYKNIFALTRNPEKLAEYAKKGVIIKAGDFDKANTLTDVFTGISRVLLISTDALGSRVTQHKNAIEAMVKSGVKHVVYTSWPKANTSVASVSAEHFTTEEIIKNSGLSYTILRNYPYAENLFMSLPSAIARGALAGIAGAGKVAYVTKADCARAAAGALSSSDTSNKVLDISGPKAVSYSEIAKITSEIIGKNFTYLNMQEADFKSALMQSGLPEIWADLFVSFDLAFKNGDAEKVSSSVFDLSGVKPTDITTFLMENKKSILGSN